MCSQDAEGSMIPQRHKSTICYLPAEMAKDQRPMKRAWHKQARRAMRSFPAIKYPSKILTT